MNSKFNKGLIEMRKKVAVLTSPIEKVDVVQENNCFIATFEDNVNKKVIAIINPTEKEFSFKLPKGTCSLIVDAQNAGISEIRE